MGPRRALALASARVVTLAPAPVALAGAVASAGALVLSIAGCGSPQGGAAGSEVAVAVPAEAAPTGTETGGSGDDPAKVRTRPARAAGDVEACLRELRHTAGSGDPANASAAADYSAALEAEQSGQIATARKLFLGVVQKYPGSPVISGAYFAFGEMFGATAKSEPDKWEFAKLSYQEVIKVPPAENAFYWAGRYRLAQVHVAKADHAEALAQFSSATKADRSGSKAGCAVEIAAAALEASIAVFAEAADAAKSWSFYLTMTGDGVRAGDATLRLAERHVAAGKGTEAAQCLAASTEPAVKAIVDEGERGKRCEKIRGVAEAARRTAAPAAMSAADRAIQAVCR